MTVKVGGEAEPWSGTSRFRIDRGDGTTRFYDAEHVRAYRDRLVLKLRGIDDGNAAEALRGAGVSVALEDAPLLPQGVHYGGALVGLEVIDESDRRLGEVIQVVATRGTELLEVRRAGETETLLIPMAREIVIGIDEERGRIRVRLPEGLEELNR